MFNRVYYTIRQSFKNIKQNHKRIQYKRHYSVPPNHPNSPHDPKGWMILLVCGSLHLYYNRTTP